MRFFICQVKKLHLPLDKSLLYRYNSILYHNSGFYAVSNFSKEVLLHNYLIYRLFIVVFCDDIQTFANCFFSENCISVFIVHKISVPYSYYS